MNTLNYTSIYNTVNYTTYKFRTNMRTVFYFNMNIVIVGDIELKLWDDLEDCTGQTLWNVRDNP